MLNLKFQQMNFFAQQKLLILVFMMMLQFPMKIVNFHWVIFITN